MENGSDFIEGRRPACHQLTVLLDQNADVVRRRGAVAGSLIAGSAGESAGAYIYLALA